MAWRKVSCASSTTRNTLGKWGDAAADGCARYDIQLAVDRMQEIYTEVLQAS